MLAPDDLSSNISFEIFLSLIHLPLGQKRDSLLKVNRFHNLTLKSINITLSRYACFYIDSFFFTQAPRLILIMSIN